MRQLFETTKHAGIFKELQNVQALKKDARRARRNKVPSQSERKAHEFVSARSI